MFFFFLLGVAFCYHLVHCCLLSLPYNKCVLHNGTIICCHLSFEIQQIVKKWLSVVTKDFEFRLMLSERQRQSIVSSNLTLVPRCCRQDLRAKIWVSFVRNTNASIRSEKERKCCESICFALTAPASGTWAHLWAHLWKITLGHCWQGPLTFCLMFFFVCVCVLKVNRERNSIIVTQPPSVAFMVTMPTIAWIQHAKPYP